MVAALNVANKMIAFVNHWELLIILAVVLVLFGNRIPKMARSLGSGITEFKRGLKDGSSKPKADDDDADSTGDSSTDRDSNG